MPDFDPCQPNATRDQRSMNCPFRADIAVIREQLASIAAEQERIEARFTNDRRHMDSQIQAILDRLNGSGVMPPLLEQAKQYTDQRVTSATTAFGAALGELTKDVKAIAADLAKTKNFVAWLSGVGGFVGAGAVSAAFQFFGG